MEDWCSISMLQIREASAAVLHAVAATGGVPSAPVIPKSGHIGVGGSDSARAMEMHRVSVSILNQEAFPVSNMR